MIGGMSRNGQPHFSRDCHSHGSSITADSMVDDLPPIEAIVDAISHVAAASAARIRHRSLRSSQLPLLQCAVPDSNIVVQAWHSDDALPDQFSACGRHMFPVGPRLIIVRDQGSCGTMATSKSYPPVPPKHLLPLSLAQQYFVDDEDIISLDSAGPLSLIAVEASSTTLKRSSPAISTFANPATYPSTAALLDSCAAGLQSDLIGDLAHLPRHLPILIPTASGGCVGLRVVTTATDPVPITVTITHPTVLPPLSPLLMPTSNTHSDLTAGVFDSLPPLASLRLSDMQVVAQYVLGPGVFATVRWRALAAPATVQAFLAANSARAWRGIELGQGLLASHPEVVVHVHQVDKMGSPQIRKVEREVKESIRFWRIVEGEETWGESEMDGTEQEDVVGDHHASDVEGQEEEDHPRPTSSRPAKRAKVMGVADRVDDFLDHMSNLGNDPSVLFGDDANLEDDLSDDDFSVPNQPSLITDADLTTSPTMSRRVLPTRTDHDFTERLWIYLRAARNPDDLADALDVIAGAIESGTLVPQVALPNPTYFASTLRKFVACTALESTSVVKVKALEEVKNDLDIFVAEPLPQLLEVSLWKLARDCMHYFTELDAAGVIALAGEWAQMDHFGMILVLRAWVKALAVLVHVDTYAPGLPRSVLNTVAEKLVSQRLAHLRLEAETEAEGEGIAGGEGDEEGEDEGTHGGEHADEMGEDGAPKSVRDDSHLGSFPLSAFSPDTAQFVSRLPPASRWSITLASRTPADDDAFSPCADGPGDGNIGQGGGSSSIMDAVWTIDVRRRDDLAGMLDGDELETVEQAKASMGEHPDTDTPRFEVTVGMAECFLV